MNITAIVLLLNISVTIPYQFTIHTFFDFCAYPLGQPKFIKIVCLFCLF